MKEKINIIINEINEITNYLYQHKLNEGYTKLNSTLQSIIELTEDLFNYQQNSNKIIYDQNKLIDGLKNALEAMEKQDILKLSDVLLYDLVVQLNESVLNIG